MAFTGGENGVDREKPDRMSHLGKSDRMRSSGRDPL